jgi:hypothetical protein
MVVLVLDTPVRRVFLNTTLYPKWKEIDVSFLPHHKGPITSTYTRMDEDDLGKVTGPKENTGVSEWLTSTHPEATSVWCVWTQVYAGVVVICSDQPVNNRCVVVDFVTRWKEFFMNM